MTSLTYHTLTPDEEAEWLVAVQDGSLWPFRYPTEQGEESEQMWLWRQDGALLKEIGIIVGLSAAGVWYRVRTFEEREAWCST